jgi:hypothetical protein
MVTLQGWGTHLRIRPDYTGKVFPSYSKMLARVLRNEQINFYKRYNLLKQVEPSAKRQKFTTDFQVLPAWQNERKVR